jgi:hypothetical protein
VADDEERAGLVLAECQQAFFGLAVLVIVKA